MSRRLESSLRKIPPTSCSGTRSLIRLKLKRNKLKRLANAMRLLPQQKRHNLQQSHHLTSPFSRLRILAPPPPRWAEVKHKEVKNVKLDGPKEAQHQNVVVASPSEVSHLRPPICHVHPGVSKLFPLKVGGQFPTGGRIKHFLENWKVLTNDQSILRMVQG